MQGLPSILSLFRNKFNKFNKTGAQMLDSIYHMILFVLVLYVPSQQLWSLRDGQFTLPHFFLGRIEQADNQ